MLVSMFLLLVVLLCFGYFVYVCPSGVFGLLKQTVSFYRLLVSAYVRVLLVLHKQLVHTNIGLLGSVCTFLVVLSRLFESSMPLACIYFIYVQWCIITFIFAVWGNKPFGLLGIDPLFLLACGVTGSTATSVKTGVIIAVSTVAAATTLDTAKTVTGEWAKSSAQQRNLNAALQVAKLDSDNPGGERVMNYYERFSGAEAGMNYGFAAQGFIQSQSAARNQVVSAMQQVAESVMPGVDVSPVLEVVVDTVLPGTDGAEATQHVAAATQQVTNVVTTSASQKG